MSVRRNTGAPRAFRREWGPFFLLHVVNPGSGRMTGLVAGEQNPLVVGKPFHAIEVNTFNLRKSRFSGTSGKQHQSGALPFMVDTGYPFTIRRQRGPISIAQAYGG